MSNVKTSVTRTQASALVSTPSVTLSIHFLTIATGQVGKILGDRWKALNEKQRQPYEGKAAEDKKRYEAEKAKYQV